MFLSGVYYCATLFLITFSTAINVFVLNIVDRDTPVPAWIRVVLLHYLAKLVAPSLRQVYWTEDRRAARHAHSVDSQWDFTDKSQGRVNCDTVEWSVHSSANGVTQVEECPQVGFYSSRLASNSPVYKMSLYQSVQPDSPIKEITELKLDETGKQLVQVRKYLEWIRVQMETLMNDVESKNETDRLRSDWQAVAVIVDRSLMFIFTLVFLTTIIWVYNQYPSKLIHPSDVTPKSHVVIME